jgi:hypothetical protein
VIYTPEAAEKKFCPFKTARWPPMCDGPQCMGWKELTNPDGSPLDKGYCVLTSQGAVTELSRLLLKLVDGE